MSHAYLLALEIEPVDINKVYVALPLHCTVMHWFRSDKTPAQVLQAITTVVHAQAPIELMSGPADLFGHKQDVPVNRILNHEEVRTFHEALLEKLEAIGVEQIEPQWTRAGYSPHVTRQSNGRFEEGRRHVSRKLYLVEAMVPGELQLKKIISKITLGTKG